MKEYLVINPSPVPVRRFSETNWFTYALVFLGAFFLYLMTCAPGALWQDSGIFQMRVVWADYTGDLGLALSHPLYIFLARLASFVPLGDLAWRVNCLSAIGGALTVANLYLAVRWLTRRYRPALLAALTCALGHTIWRHAVIAEVYTLYTALLTFELLCLIHYGQTGKARWLYVQFFLNGLAWSDHNLALLALFCYGIFVLYLLAKRNIRFGHLAILIVCWLIGGLPLEMLMVGQWFEGVGMDQIVHSVLFGKFQDAVLNISVPYGRSILFILLNFPTPNLLLLIPGSLYLWKGLRPHRTHTAMRSAYPTGWVTRILLLQLVVFFLFAVRYRVPDQYSFFIPFYVMASLAIGLAGHHLFSSRPRWMAIALILACLPVPVYAWGPGWLENHNIAIPGMKRSIPFRNEYRYFLQPWKHNEYSTAQFVSTVQNAIPFDSIIIADSTTLYPLLYYQQVKNELNDFYVFRIIHSTAQDGSIGLARRCSHNNNVPDQITSTNIDHLLAQRHVYVVSAQPGYCPAWLLDHYVIEPVFPLYQIVGRKAQPPSDSK